MSGTKAALKAINDAIRQQKFDDAVSKAKELMEKDPKNYQAWEYQICATQQRAAVPRHDRPKLTTFPGTFS